MAKPIVKIAAAAWEQILELRQDAVSRQKLRRLRQVLISQSLGKTREQIEAAISLKMEGLLIQRQVC